ncbi:lytic transglycosylase domain-containing protein [Paenibacillus filicis]|uniref:Lytic transglycosylase domain-containing protein n=1 Tax=Paenibacillus gyeongsangnamensis TaxID=3388067 RepID=A0ABT4Q3A9_9BACL|nr:lytic transglycosylase domain-containing protein [Paenibacillus filicis]MCZ8511195.1 lytic transglycosylase domain-containing protein [Paenibacillus filicis]
MSIDPRTVKELLQLQVWNKTGILSSNGPESREDDGVFNDLLGELMAQGAPAVKPNEDAPKGKMAFSPVPLHPAYGAGAAPGAAAAGARAAVEPFIQAASRKFGVNSSLVTAVIDAESSFNPKAVSGAGAKGLMQLMDSTGQGLGMNDPFDPAQNIEGGTRYLSRLLAIYGGNEATALAAYNGGPGRLAKLGIASDADLQAKLHLLPQETQQYVSKVLRLKQHYEA